MSLRKAILLKPQFLYGQLYFLGKQFFRGCACVVTTSKNSIMQLRICSILVLFVFLCKLQWLNRRHYLWSYPCATMNLVVSEKFAFFFFFLLLLLNKISIPGDIQHQVALPECSQHPDLAVGIPVIAGELDDMIFMGHFQFKQF